MEELIRVTYMNWGDPTNKNKTYNTKMTIDQN